MTLLAFDRHQGDLPRLTIRVLSGGYRLLMADLDAPPGRLRPLVDGQPAPAPYTILTLPMQAGGVRAIAVLRVPERLGGAVVELEDADGTVQAEGEDSGEVGEPSDCLDGLTPAARLRLVRLILDFGRNTAVLRSDPAYADLCRRLVTILAPRPKDAPALLAATDRLVYAETTVPGGFGAVLDSLVLHGDGLSAMPVRARGDDGPDRNGRLPVRMMLDRAQVRADALIVLMGEGGLALRRPMGSTRRLSSLLDMTGGKRRLPGPVRDYVLSALEARREADPTAAAALREAQALAVLPRRHLASPAKPLGCALDLAVTAPDGGMFVAGWMHDPDGLVDRLRLLSPFGPARELPTPPLRFARPDVTTLYKATGADRPGFAAWLPGPVRDAMATQLRGELVLRSGGTVPLVPPPRAADWAAVRAAILAAVPQDALTPATLESVIAPAVRSVHAECLADRAEPEVIRFGAPVVDPAVSVIIPLYRNLEFLRFQLSAFALDPAMAEVELLFLLDSPEQRDELVHYLSGLHGLYGLPLTLIVQPRNFGYAVANNTAARFARAPFLLCLNSDVVPDRPGWLSRLVEMLEDNPELGAVGPKLLFDDDSLQHAGLYFDRDTTGRWYNHHYFKGMPRDFAPADRMRLVPGVTGACLLMPRALYQDLGGFSEDYVIGDFEDSDLCLRIRRAGFEILYEPRVELYHLERRSISRHTGHSRGVASLYNGWLHAGRWSDTMAELMSRDWSGGRRL